MELKGVQKALSPALKAKALDNLLPDPILGDAYAERVVRRLDPEYPKGFPASHRSLAAVVRAKVLDDWTRSFLDAHGDAVVLNLGCGLDARVFRVDPPASVDWFDLDVPAVIDLRQQLLPPREHCTFIGADVTDVTWLYRIPRGRATLMIAEGLVPHLREADLRRLLVRFVDRFPTGELAFDTVSVPAWRTSRWGPLGGEDNAEFRSGLNDPAALAAWHPRLTFADEAPINDSPELMAKAPACARAMYRLMNLLPGFQHSRTVVRFRF